MPPQLIPCPFCDRLYTHYSIDLHQPQCLSNPNRKVKLPQLKRSANSLIRPESLSHSKPLPILADRRSRSVDSNSLNSSNSSVESNNENRPATRRIDQTSLKNANGRPPKSRKFFKRHFSSYYINR